MRKVCLETVDTELELYTVTIRRRPMYTVSFDTVGGTRVDPLTVEEDSFASAPVAPTKIGYTFAGWEYDFSAPIVTDTEIIANWTANEYTVTYDVNGGNAPASRTQTVTYGAAYTLATPTRRGYTFAGWYLDGVKVENGTWTRLENVTLTAEWSANSYTVTYDVNGGNALASRTQTVTYDASYTLATPTRTGYTFAGWYLDGVKVENGTWTRIENVTLTAEWTIVTYEISYTLNGGSAENKSSYTVEDAFTLNAPTRRVGSNRPFSDLRPAYP